nr:MAG: rep protein [Cressdnaviricota sp.]
MTDVKWWDFTCPEDKAGTDEGLQILLDDLCDRWVYGHEIGKDGYKHIQGRVVFKKPKELATIRNQTEVMLPTAHWSKTQVRNFDYCEKEGNFVRSWEKALRKYASIELLDWQAQTLEFWNNQNDRQVHVIIGQGNDGKSWFSKFMEATHRADVCPVCDGEASNYVEYVPLARVIHAILYIVGRFPVTYGAYIRAVCCFHEFTKP